MDAFEPPTVWRILHAPATFVCVFVMSRACHGRVPAGFCIARRLIGMRCPGCGITTSVAALFHGRPAAALRANAAGPLVVLFVAVQLCIAAASTSRRVARDTIARASRLNGRALFAALIAAWVVRIVKED